MAKIVNFPRAARRRISRSPAPVRYVVRRRSWVHSSGFGLLFCLTLPVAFLYLSGAAHIARRDTLYAVLLAAIWSLYFLHPSLLRTCLGTLLLRAGLLLAFASVAGFFTFVYWLILSHP